MNLSPRQAEVVRELRKGLTDKEIGRALGLSFETVKQHIGNAMKRTGARGRVHLAVMAERAAR